MSLTRELPRYRCHKHVWALKIKAIIENPRGHELHFEDENYAPHLVPAGWVEKRGALPGGYYVSYSDGYDSFSPAHAFEAGYTRVGSTDALQATADRLAAIAIDAGVPSCEIPVSLGGVDYVVTVAPVGGDV